MTRRTRLVLAAAAFATAVFLIGAAFGASNRPASGPPEADGASAPAPPAAPGYELDPDHEDPTQVPTDPATDSTTDRSQHGAVAAATSFVLRLDGPVLLDPRRLSEVLEQIAARDARADLAASIGAVADQVLSHLHLTAADFTGPGFVWRAAPAGWQIRDYSPDHATVAVWGTGVVMVEGRRLVEPGWATTEVAMRWERGAWRLVRFRTVEGPQPPATGQQADPLVAERISAFEPYAYRPAAAATGR